MPGAAFKPIGRLGAARLVVSALGSGLASSCAAPPAETPVGVSDALPDREVPSRSPKPRPGSRRPHFAVALAWPEAAPPFRALEHRRDGTLIHVRVDPSVPEALAAYRDLSVEAPLPDGARLVAWHETPAGAPLGGYMLEKHAGLWSALELDAQGSVIAGDRAPCVRCHDMAPTDHLFGVPRPAPQASPRPDTAGALRQESIERSPR